MKISIVTPSLNQGGFIEDTIRSVISQQGNFDLEYIIMDGGSTDSTLSIIRRYGKLINSKKFNPKCNRLSFKWFSEKDRGQSHAINKGFRMAKGDIINWLCSDDMLEKGALQEVARFFESNDDAEVVYGNGLEIDEKGKILKTYKGADFSRSDLIRVWSRAYSKFHIAQPSVFVKRGILRKHGFLNEKNHLCMDYEWYLKINQGSKFHYIDRMLSRNHFHGNCKSLLFRREQSKATMDCSKRYWKENYLYYMLSYCTCIPAHLYEILLFLESKSKTCSKLIGYIRKYKRKL